MLDNQSLIKRMTKLLEAGRTFSGAKVYYREDWGVYYFDLAGKQFGLMSKAANEKAVLTIKGLPEENISLRQTYSDIVPGYYANKQHWNSILLCSEQLSDIEITELLQASYQLVFQKLTKKVQLEINAYL
ncbi:MmcQ/YjbR family DNA-binding protein [Terribacillus saccharophilus]|uniref:MmcQ/YjbR family DNA-binding protein n=1 Tax=Terribacillus saccharophilus TaxID=361277 RepID=UPI001595494C|nr:MmcQ/YjbR family DNA-binding protein [Terribacillus saccharophilus]